MPSPTYNGQIISGDCFWNHILFKQAMLATCIPITFVLFDKICHFEISCDNLQGHQMSNSYNNLTAITQQCYDVSDLSMCCYREVYKAHRGSMSLINKSVLMEFQHKTSSNSVHIYFVIPYLITNLTEFHFREPSDFYSFSHDLTKVTERLAKHGKNRSFQNKQ